MIGQNKITELVEKKDFEYIIMGGAFLGSGGGGPVAAGKQIMEDVLAHKVPVKVVDVQTLKSQHGLNGAVVAFMGSPSAGAQGIDLETPTNAFNALENFKPLDFAMLIEIGAGNSMVPMSVAVRKNIPILDGDGAGRAVPKIQNTTYAQVTSPSPAALSNGKQKGLPTVDNIILMRDIPQNQMADALEAYSLNILEIPTFGQMGGLATYMLSSEEVESATIGGTLTLSYEIGKVILDAIEAGGEATENLKKYFQGVKTPCYTFEKGTITKIETPSDKSGDLDLGTVTVEDGEGNTLLLSYENENLFATLNGKPWAMAPDLICYLGETGAMSNVEIQIGDKVTIFGLAANEKMRSKNIVDGFMSELKALDIYNGEYISIENLHRK